MEADIFLETSFGKAAMKKIGPVAEGFMLYEAGWLGDNPRQRDVMEVKGAIFREAKTGPNKGKRTVMVKESRVTVYVTAAPAAGTSQQSRFGACEVRGAEINERYTVRKGGKDSRL